MEEHVFSGPPINVEPFDGSLGQYLMKTLKTRDPNKVAHVHYETGEQMTNGEFLTMSQKIANGFELIGIRPGDLVVLLGKNSMRISLTATACFFNNAVFAPQDPTLKQHELKNIFQTYLPNFVFCHREQSKMVLNAVDALELNTKVYLFEDESDDVRLRGFSDLLSHDKVDFKPKPIGDPAKEAALVAASSGSTGLPKGVAINHQSLTTFCIQISMFEKTDGYSLQTSHLFWISGIYSLLASICLDQPRVFLSELTTENILKAIKKYEPRSTFMSPSEMASIIKRPDLKPDDLGPKSMIISTGGAPLPKFVAEQMLEKFKPAPLILPTYGCTENVSSISYSRPLVDITSVGQITPGVHVKIVDTATNVSLGPGQVGEIRVKHPNQMIGYLNNPQATKEAFDENGYLRTGDLGYVSEKGFLYIVGRIKNAIKYRNMHISLVEIENLLMELDGVFDVGVVAIPNEEDDNHVMALIVKQPNTNLTEEDVSNYVEENMASHNKLRGGVKFVDEIPRNAHKKVKRMDLNALGLRLYAEGK